MISFRRISRRFRALLVALLACGLPSEHAASAEDVYSDQIKPFLKSRCFSCHGALKQEAGLRLDGGKNLIRGSDGGPIVVSGSPQQSRILARLRATDSDQRMPPEGEPASAEIIRHFEHWIRDGAEWPADDAPEADPLDHWAFRVPVRPSIPPLEDHGQGRGAIDHFLADRRAALGVHVVEEAPRVTLLRRLYLDLIGVPPSSDELETFLTDDSPNAYEKVVDRLLTSPQYGERWGRHWMDVWRYSDWYGRRKVPDSLNSYGQIWRWRDWIVRSLNEGKGYDRMVVEMLAADELCPEDDENVVATGFLVRNFYRWNYNNWMKDNVEHTGKAFLGLTLNCCHCHDHKYDPLTNIDYFRFRAFFEPIEIRHSRVPNEPDPGPYPKYSYGKAYKPLASGLVRIMDEKLDAETFVYTGGEARNVIDGEPPVPPGPPSFLETAPLTISPVELPPTVWYPGLRPFVQQAALDEKLAEVSRMTDILAKARQAVAEDETSTLARLTLAVDETNLQRAHRELEAVQARIRADQIRYLGAEGDPANSSAEAGQAERIAAADIARVELKRAERAVWQADHPRDDAAAEKAEKRLAAAKAALEKAEATLADTSQEYTAFSTQYPKQSTGRRTALASWIADRKNPLTARVAVNHVWLRHFGQAIVATPENLGRSGARPTHPELLDWLAVELMDQQWDLKQLHRQIVTSSAYRLASTESSPHKNRSQDVDNILYWKFPARRMESEVLRDSILSVSEELDLQIGGKELSEKEGLTSRRRSLYFEHHGEGRMEFLDLFDAPDPCDAYRRSKSIRPQQALAMMNSELTLRLSRVLAHRLSALIGVGPESTAEFVGRSFRQVLSRDPTEQEMMVSSAFLKDQTELFRSSKLEAAGNDSDKSAGEDPRQQSRESFIQALFSHHDFCSIR